MDDVNDLNDRKRMIRGTNIYDPLNHVFNQKAADPKLTRQIFLLTDGEPSPVDNTREIIELVEENMYN